MHIAVYQPFFAKMQLRKAGKALFSRHEFWFCRRLAGGCCSFISVLMEQRVRDI